MDNKSQKQQKMVELYERKMSVREICSLLDISRQTFYNWKALEPYKSMMERIDGNQEASVDLDEQIIDRLNDDQFQALKTAIQRRERMRRTSREDIAIEFITKELIEVTEKDFRAGYEFLERLIDDIETVAVELALKDRKECDKSQEDHVRELETMLLCIKQENDEANNQNIVKGQSIPEPENGPVFDNVQV